MNLDALFSQVGTLLTAPLVFLLVARRIHKTLPAFVAYQAFTFITGLAGACLATYAPAAYLYFWAPYCLLDLVFCLAVLVELGRNVLMHDRPGDGQWLIPALVFPFITLLFWSLAPWPHLPRSEWMWQMNFRALQAAAVMQTSGLVTLVLWSSLRKLRWPERELHIITGIGMWTPVLFSVLILHTHGFFGGRYRWLDLLTPASCILVTVYWLHYFWLEPGPAVVPRKRSVAEAVSAHRLDGSDALTIQRILCGLRRSTLRNVTLVHVLWSGEKSH